MEIYVNIVPQCAFPLHPYTVQIIEFVMNTWLIIFAHGSESILCFWLNAFLSHRAMGPSVSGVPNRDVGQVGVFEPSHRGPRGIWKLLKD